MMGRGGEAERVESKSNILLNGNKSEGQALGRQI
jgi:hypothetical protein